MPKPKILVVYFSRTGITRQVAKVLALELRADIAEIKTSRYKPGRLGFFQALWDSTLSKAVPIDNRLPDASKYDVVVIGTPVWSSSISSPVRTYLDKVGYSPARVAFFLTHKVQMPQRIFREMEHITGKSPITTLAVSIGALRGKLTEERVASFVEDITKSFEPRRYTSHLRNKTNSATLRSDRHV